MTSFIYQVRNHKIKGWKINAQPWPSTDWEKKHQYLQSACKEILEWPNRDFQVKKLCLVRWEIKRMRVNWWHHIFGVPLKSMTVLTMSNFLHDHTLTVGSNINYGSHCAALKKNLSSVLTSMSKKHILEVSKLKMTNILSINKLILGATVLLLQKLYKKHKKNI